MPHLTDSMPPPPPPFSQDYAPLLPSIDFTPESKGKAIDNSPGQKFYAAVQASSCESFEIQIYIQCKKKVSHFQSPAGMSLTKLSLAGNSLIIPGRGEFG
jgi:hypothetical protein